MVKPFKVNTSEGEAKGKEGDFLAVGIDREMWPIEKELFFKTMKLITPGIQKGIIGRPNVKQKTL